MRRFILHGAWCGERQVRAFSNEPSDMPTQIIILPGHGQGETPGWQTIASYRRHVEQVIGTEPCVLGAHSMGVLIALLVAKRCKNVCGLELMAGAAPGVLLSGDAFAALLGYLGAILLGYACALGEREQDSLFLDAQTQELRGLFGYESGWALFWLALWQLRFWWRLGRDIPIIVIAGGQDRIFPARGQERLAKRLGADFYVVPAAGHMLTAAAWAAPVAARLRFSQGKPAAGLQVRIAAE